MAQQLKVPSLLVALPHLMDPNFHKTVVLLVQQNQEGSLGYIINKPYPTASRDAAFQKLYQIPAHVPVWLGGPVGAHEGVVIHNQGHDAQASIAAGGLRVSSSEDAIEGFIEHVESGIPAARRRGELLYPYRFVIGYAGWGPKALENELKAGSWLQLPLDEKVVFATPWQEMWVHVMDDLGVEIQSIAPAVQHYLS